jgi:hypothetical protein
LGDYKSLSKKLLTDLSEFAAQSEDETIHSQHSLLNDALLDIDRSSNDPRADSSPLQIAKKLTGCLQRVVSQCTVVIFLSSFDRLESESVKEWLITEWIMTQVCRSTELSRASQFLQGLVIVITGEGGLNSLRGNKTNGIFYLDKEPDLSVEELLTWARKDYNLDWFSYALAEKLHEKYQSDIASLATSLQSYSILTEFGYDPPAAQHIEFSGRPSRE